MTSIPAPATATDPAANHAPPADGDRGAARTWQNPPPGLSPAQRQAFRIIDLQGLSEDEVIDRLLRLRPAPAPADALGPAPVAGGGDDGDQDDEGEDQPCPSNVRDALPWRIEGGFVLGSDNRVICTAPPDRNAAFQLIVASEMLARSNEDGAAAAAVNFTPRERPGRRSFQAITNEYPYQVLSRVGLTPQGMVDYLLEDGKDVVLDEDDEDIAVWEAGTLVAAIRYRAGRPPLVTIFEDEDNAPATGPADEPAAATKAPAPAPPSPLRTRPTDEDLDAEVEPYDPPGRAERRTFQVVSGDYEHGKESRRGLTLDEVLADELEDGPDTFEDRAVWELFHGEGLRPRGARVVAVIRTAPGREPEVVRFDGDAQGDELGAEPSTAAG